MTIFPAEKVKLFGDGYMIDTVRLRIMFNNPDQYHTIKSRQETIVKLVDGELMWEMTNGHLLGSWDSRISLSFRDKDYFKDLNTGRPMLRPCAPFLICECSLHKLLLGHNVYGMDCDLSRLSVLYDLLEKNFGTFINREKVEVHRIDIAECYKFESSDYRDKLMDTLKNYRKYRVRPIMYKTETLYWPSTMVTFKIYDKEAEYKSHDYKRLKKVDGKFADEIKFMSENVLRLEAEFKKRKLEELFDGNLEVSNLMKNIIVLKDWHKKEKDRVMTSTDDDVKIEKSDVLGLLRMHCKPTTANSIFSFWTQLTSFGDDFVRGSYSNATYYRFKKVLRELKISTFESVVMTEMEGQPNFKPTFKEELRLTLLKVVNS